MKVIEHYDKASEPLISFEIIPPKRGGSVSEVFESLDKIVKYNPPFIDVTYHAAESYFEELPDGTIKRHIKRKRPGTIGLCAAMKHKYGVDPVPHLICEGFTKEETEDALIELNYLGIDNVLAIRGDAPDDNVPRYKNGTYNEYAIDLVSQIQDMNDGKYLEDIVNAHETNFCVGVAGYPEKHFEAPNLDRDIARLKEKVDAGGDYIVTQMFFDNDAYFRFVDKCREAGIEVPIVPGLKVLTRERHLNFLPKFFHLNIPKALSEEVIADPDNAQNIGIEWSTQQCIELLEGGAPGIHFYVMGDPTPALDVIDKLPLGATVKKK
ncbi:methylenetetrahydrofolate reductase [Aliifodinibius sp. S!AR15-10]|uniref:methylenetetrahydrofolate reductase n=1 Tax=Aliifodinibius sp. S!AR15-10 TaxID=2950437 RepID=UPI00285D2067|nr:methylenetetrahydrofolate reductase [Aliifodinibius sp. S!AR15-10]MDR8393589.1 methylenetetrahydrofolate reductase [Aliifodinibius sp. S!AR15-10]